MANRPAQEARKATPMRLGKEEAARIKRAAGTVPLSTWIRETADAVAALQLGLPLTPEQAARVAEIRRASVLHLSLELVRTAPPRGAPGDDMPQANPVDVLEVAAEGLEREPTQGGLL